MQCLLPASYDNSSHYYKKKKKELFIVVESELPGITESVIFQRKDSDLYKTETWTSCHEFWNSAFWGLFGLWRNIGISKYSHFPSFLTPVL